MKATHHRVLDRTIAVLAFTAAVIMAAGTGYAILFTVGETVEHFIR